jgi:hypothetical protein
MRTAVLTLSVAALYLLHQDFWFWRDGRLVFGAVPVGLFYHALYCVACTGMMWALVKFAWPDLRTGTGTGSAE